MGKINIAVIGVGNCTSSLVQGIHYYRKSLTEHINGLMHREIGGYAPEDVHVSAAFDIDSRKVGKDLSRAVFEKPNCTKVFCSDIPETGITVQMGRILDGCPEHMSGYDADKRFMVSDAREPDKKDVVDLLRETETDIIANYLPVGSRKATEFYAECALEAGTGFINNIPVFIASDEKWSRRFREKGLPLIGDDIKAQLGATITHR
ncbi:MAG: inositol-3-phosphate synthase, partial [Chitinivibrionales bacterium]